MYVTAVVLYVVDGVLFSREPGRAIRGHVAPLVVPPGGSRPLLFLLLNSKASSEVGVVRTQAH